jgi:hypothetical protein
MGFPPYHYYLAIKLPKNELQKDSEDPLTLFRNGIKSKETLEKYERNLKVFLCHTLDEHLTGNPQKRESQKQQRLARGIKREIEDILDADFEERTKEFVDKCRQDPQWALSIFKAYANKLIEHTRMIFSCQNCNKSFKTEDETDTKLVLWHYITEIPEDPNVVAQKEFLETNVEKQQGENVAVVDKDDSRIMELYRELADAIKTTKDGEVIYSCPSALPNSAG